MQHCPKCNESKDNSMFYMRTGTERTHSYCKSCVSKQTMQRQRKLKAICVEYMGGKCADCGGVFHNGVYDFHHLDQSKKDFALGKRRSLKFSDEIKSELAKCVMLCSNCHRMRHITY